MTRTGLPPTPIASSRRRSSHMPTGKRASMREGPLAALFRRTTEDQGEDSPAADAPPPSGSERAPETAAAAPSQAPPPPVEEPRIPSPQERLRQAFSAEIPESLLEPPPPPPAPPRFDAVPPADRYAEGFSRPASIGSPVIRVVGVGGAGVN